MHIAPTEAEAAVDPMQDVDSAEFRCTVHGECGEPSGDGKRGKQKLQRRKAAIACVLVGLAALRRFRR